MKREKIHRALWLMAAGMLMACGGASCGRNAENTKSIDAIQSEASGGREKESSPGASVRIDDGRPMVLDFSATWCPPCQQLKPVFAKLTKKYEERVTMVTVDVDENKDMAQQFSIEAIPTLIFFNSRGETVDRVSGLISEQELEHKLDALLASESAAQ